MTSVDVTRRAGRRKESPLDPLVTRTPSYRKRHEVDTLPLKSVVESFKRYAASIFSWCSFTAAFLYALRVPVSPPPSPSPSLTPPDARSATREDDEVYWVITQSPLLPVLPEATVTSRKLGSTFILNPDTGMFERFVMAFLHRENAEKTLYPLSSLEGIDDRLDVERVSWEHLSSATLTSLGVAVFDSEAMNGHGWTKPCRLVRRMTTEDIGADPDVTRTVADALNRCLIIDVSERRKTYE